MSLNYSQEPAKVIKQEESPNLLLLFPLIRRWGEYLVDIPCAVITIRLVGNFHSWALILFQNDHQEIKNDCQESMKVARQWELMFPGR